MRISLQQFNVVTEPEPYPANNLNFKLHFKLFNFTGGIVNDWTLIAIVNLLDV